MELRELNISKAWGIAYSSFTRRIYMTDMDSHRIVVYHEDGRVDKYFGKLGTNSEEFCQPTGIAVDDLNHRLVITDKNNHRVCFYYMDGEFLFSFGNKGCGNGEFNQPWGVSVSPKDGTIAVADSRNQRLQIFDSYGKFLKTSCALDFKTEFINPRGVSFDKNGENIYVTDFKLQTIVKLDIDLTSSTTMLPQELSLNRPQGIAVDTSGNILICDSLNNCIRLISPEGKYMCSIFGKDSFLYPLNLAVTATGEIIVVDSNSNIVIF